MDRRISQTLNAIWKKAMVSLTKVYLSLISDRISAASIAECERLELEARQKEEELRQLQAQEVRGP